MTEIQNPIAGAKVVGDNIDPSAYHHQDAPRGDRQFVMSRGQLMEFNRCPHRWKSGYESDDTKATEWGSLIDCLALTPERFDQCFAITPQDYQNEKGEKKPWNWNANVCKEWRDERDGLQIVKHDLNKEAIAAVSVLRADPQIADLLANSQKQVMVIGRYDDPDTKLNIQLKCLIDLVPLSEPYRKALADLKTCMTASPYPWSRAVFERGYHVQAALELDLFTAATGEERIEFLHVLQESYAPWEIGRRLVSAEFIELGRMSYLGALQRYCRCVAEDRWPGYDDEGREVINGWQITQPEPWMLARM